MGDSVTAISYQVVNVDPAPPSKLNPSLRPSFDRILRKALSKAALGFIQAVSQNLSSEESKPDKEKGKLPRVVA